jgi:hypothetical protein
LLVAAEVVEVLLVQTEAVVAVLADIEQHLDFL